MTDMNPNKARLHSQIGFATRNVVQWFEYEHLPEHLQPVSKAFHDLAWELVANLVEQPELTVALRKLLEAKDCAVRAALGKTE